jgi:hypothetical protein
VEDGGKWLQDELARIILKRLSARIRHLSGEHRCHFPRCQQPVLVVWPVLPPCAALQISSSGFVARAIRLVRCPAAGALYLPPSSAAMLFPGQVCVGLEKYAVRPARSGIQIFELGEDLGRPLELRPGTLPYCLRQSLIVDAVVIETRASLACMWLKAQAVSVHLTCSEVDCASKQ